MTDYRMFTCYRGDVLGKIYIYRKCVCVFERLSTFIFISQSEIAQKIGQTKVYPRYINYIYKLYNYINYSTVL